MRLIYNFNFFFLLILINTTYAQSTTFHLTGKIIGKDSGIVVLYYTNAENKNLKDTANLRDCNFKFSGTVNRVSDAYLWTDTSKHNFSDSSVVRFLLEPGSITIVIYNKSNVAIKGSQTQLEKENFDKQKSDLSLIKNQLFFKYDSLYKQAKQNSNPIIKNELNKLYGRIDSINKYQESIDLIYIRSHENSYLSGFLLSTYKRRLPIDTLQLYYSLLSVDVKESSEGYKVIDYLYPLTNDVKFRKKNPIYGVEYNKKLEELKSIYYASLPDTSGKLVKLDIFRGKYLLIDFWASWCEPCLQNMPYFEKLMKGYKSDPIGFISVSLDTRSKDWKKAIEKYHLNGVQLSDLKGFEGIVPVYCKVRNGIPQYVLINKEGKIINYNTPQPKNPDLKRLIDNMLRNQNYIK